MGVMVMNKIKTNKGLLDNVCINSDSYKQGHFKFMKTGTTSVYSYIESRLGAKFDEVVFFGFQMYLKKFLMKRVTQKMIDQASVMVTQHGLPFNKEGWEYVLKHHNGRLPLRIMAVEEGSVTPVGTALVTVENTDPNCAWAANFIETAALRATWYGTTVASQGRAFKKIIKKYLEETGTPTDIDFKLIDFSSRGVESFEASTICGAAHLVNFMGTDNLVGIAASMEYYDTDELTGYSIPASEHSVTCERGRGGELEFFSDAIDTFLTGPGTMVSIVIDTYSTANAIKLFGVELKDKVIASGGRLVLRPDSGNPINMVLFVVQELEKYYGTIINEKGYKVLHNSVRVLQGDGINIEMVPSILENLKNNGYSADNVTFGSGGGLAQNVTRDTNRFAQKASHVVIDGVAHNIQKIPETDPSKASKAGRLAVVNRNGVVLTVPEQEILDNEQNLLRVVYENGRLYNNCKFAKVRDNAKV